MWFLSRPFFSECLNVLKRVRLSLRNGSFFIFVLNLFYETKIRGVKIWSLDGVKKNTGTMHHTFPCYLMSYPRFRQRSRVHYPSASLFDSESDSEPLSCGGLTEGAGSEPSESSSCESESGSDSKSDSEMLNWWVSRGGGKWGVVGEEASLGKWSTDRNRGTFWSHR